MMDEIKMSQIESQIQLIGGMIETTNGDIKFQVKLKGIMKKDVCE